MRQLTVYNLEKNQEVGCFFCMQQRHYGVTYKRGEAFLCGADHTPCDGNANYVCLFHLDPEVAYVFDPVTNKKSSINEWKQK